MEEYMNNIHGFLTVKETARAEEGLGMVDF